MKKFFASILAVIYFSTSMGATVHLHYCMGKLFSLSLIDKGDRSCGQCGILKNDRNSRCKAFKEGCCKDKQIHVQLGKDQKTAENSYTSLAIFFIALPGTTATLPDLYVVSNTTGHPRANAPPGPDKIPLFIRYCTFRI